MGKRTESNPTDRGKTDTKRSIVIDSQGIPLILEVAGANRHDTTLFLDTLLSCIIEKPKVRSKKQQHLCAAKGYDAEGNRILAEIFDYIVHIKSRHEEKKQKSIIQNFVQDAG